MFLLASSLTAQKKQYTSSYWCNTSTDETVRKSEGYYTSSPGNIIETTWYNIVNQQIPTPAPSDLTAGPCPTGTASDDCCIQDFFATADSLCILDGNGLLCVARDDINNITSITDNGDGTITHIDELGNTTVINVGGDETITTLVDNGDGTYTYTSEDNTVTTIDAANVITTLVDNGDGTITYTDENGDTFVINTGGNNTDDQAISFDCNTEILTLEDGGTADLSCLAIETITTIVDNGDGTITY